jgi:hypothetical protein
MSAKFAALRRVKWRSSVQTQFALISTMPLSLTLPRHLAVKCAMTPANQCRPSAKSTPRFKEGLENPAFRRIKSGVTPVIFPRLANPNLGHFTRLRNRKRDRQVLFIDVGGFLRWSSLVRRAVNHPIFPFPPPGLLSPRDRTKSCVGLMSNGEHEQSHWFGSSPEWETESAFGSAGFFAPGVSGLIGHDLHAQKRYYR